MAARGHLCCRLSRLESFIVRTPNDLTANPQGSAGSCQLEEDHENDGSMGIQERNLR